MHGGTEAWINVRMQGGMDECTDTLVHGCMEAWMNVRIH